MPGRVAQVKILVSGRGKLAQPHVDMGGSAGGNVGIIKAPFARIDAVDRRRRRDFGSLHPGCANVAVPDSVAVEILEGFTGVPRAVTVNISERFETGTVAALRARADVIIGSIGIIDVVPDFRDAWVRAHNHTVTRSADGIVLGRELDFALRRLRIVVEGLGEGVVNGGAQAVAHAGAVPLEESARPQNVEPFR